MFEKPIIITITVKPGAPPNLDSPLDAPSTFAILTGVQTGLLLSILKQKEEKRILTPV
jgi:hypothetical protein